MNDCNRNFPEEFLTGYLDDALTQEDEQRVRLHLEDCVGCAAVYKDMSAMREVTMATEFETEDLQWDETPRGLSSRVFRNLGLIMLLGWLVAVLGLAVWLPEGKDALRWTRGINLLGICGTVLVFLSVLVDRLRVGSSDRYRGVKR